MRNLRWSLWLAVLVATPQLRADTITFTGGNGYGQYQMGQGGEFTVRPSSGLSWVLDFYSGSAKDLGNTVGTFQTFCVEKSEHIWPNATYTAFISGQTDFAHTPLTIGAAWIYSQFAAGTLANYQYTSRSTGGALQDTIWWLMGEESRPNNPFADAVVQQFGVAGAFEANNNYYPVRVLNLWEEGHVGDPAYNRQDQLVMDPPRNVPDGGLSAGLLGMSLFGLAAVKRSARKN